jgi:UDP-N-acetylglucosamine--N-acetylmuramyl-(pentapeptide) pyrophosphoryl-undecaprenol N-acetylglucosamine transferase
MSRGLKILVTGGGTGGHTIPALATIFAIKKLVQLRNEDIALQFLYVGSESGLESRLAKADRVDYVAIETGKLRRASNPFKMFNGANFRDALRVPLGFIQALYVVGKFWPDVVFSTGGYVSVPAVFAAGVLCRPVLLHEQTVQIGLANRWSAHIARRIALSFPEAAEELNQSDRAKTFVTGGVVRQIVVGGDSEAARSRFGFQGMNLPTVYITGGAQGSHVINNAVQQSLPALVRKCCIIHQCGHQPAAAVQDESRLKDAARELPDDVRDRYYVTPFIGDEIGDVYALADLVIGRSGAGTVSEVCAVGKPAIFVPLVPTGGDEQTKNAKRLVSIGAAQIITQSEISGPLLTDRVIALLDDPALRDTMGKAALTQSTPGSAENLASAVIAMALGPDGPGLSK